MKLLDSIEKRLPLKVQRYFIVVRGFFEDLLDGETSYYGASLSFYTIFAIIPLLLVTLSVVTSLPSFDEYYGELKEMIFSALIPAQTEQVSEYLDQFMENSHKLGAMGLSYVVVTSVLFFKNYEYIVSKIFGSKKRGFWESISTYWTMITLIPVGIIMSIYASGYIQVAIDERLDSSLDVISILPYALNWILFFVIFRISANIKISNKAALISSFSASFIWGILKNLFVYYVLYNKAYSSIYGSFSMILFLMLWIYLSWMILLYGFKVCAKLNRVYMRDEKKEIDGSQNIDKSS
jgi:membrane protein